MRSLDLFLTPCDKTLVIFHTYVLPPLQMERGIRGGEETQRNSNLIPEIPLRFLLPLPIILSNIA